MTSVRGPERFRWHRPIDLAVAVVGGMLALPVIVFAGLGSAISTRSSGIFLQSRIGRSAAPFTMIKLQTMRTTDNTSTVTTAEDKRITRLGRVIRRLKFDELPQLVNVARGEMALVGPRPDVAGFADVLQGGDRIILQVRPGITGPATLLMRNEERILMGVREAEALNLEVLYPLKTAVNRAWIEHGTLLDDALLLFWTVISPSNEDLYRLFSRWDPTLRSTPHFRRVESMISSEEQHPAV